MTRVTYPTGLTRMKSMIDAGRIGYEYGGRIPPPAITLREHYAGLAMQAFLTNCEMINVTKDDMATMVYYADALIEALGGKP